MKSDTTARLIEKPQMLVDLNKVGRNITRISGRLKQHGVSFRPHFKTHQCAAIGERFRSQGVSGITVSSLEMARYFADHGWNDITLAVPVHLGQLQGINELTKRIRLNLLVDCAVTAKALNDALQTTCPLWVKVDVGYGRAGVKWDDEQGLVDLVRLIEASPRLDLIGLLTHSGHTYACRGREQVIAVFEEGRQRMLHLKEMLQAQGVDVTISMGDTPSASLADNFAGVDEMRPGNCVFYDLVQSQVGSCQAQDIAVAVACPVIGRYEADQKLLVYGGAVHLSKDAAVIDGQRHFGQLAMPTPEGWQVVPLAEAHAFSCCQEVTQIRVSRSIFNQTALGQAVYLLPAHACLAAEIYPSYMTTNGETLERFRLYR